MRRILVTAALAVLLGAAPARACDFGLGSFGRSFGFGGNFGGNFGMQQSFDGFGGGGFGGLDFGLGAQSFALQPQFILQPQFHLNFSRSAIPTPFGGGNFAFRGRVRGRSFAPGFGGNLRFRGRVRGGFGGGFCPGCFP